ncbi:MAG: histidine phosphatase family protein [Clostridia bacterium]|nr:histidine phosphatase family protein [Clostridia bacterium]
MLFYYIRHGDPIYEPDSLTPLGLRQAEAVGKRLSQYGLDKIYTSTSERAVLTSKPTCEMLRMEAELLDFANETHAYRELTINRASDGKKGWLFHSADGRQILTNPELRALGFKWYEHESIAKYNFAKGMERIADNADALFASLGYEHERYSGRYRAVSPNKKRVALFAHQGFGIAFLSLVLDIPYPYFALSFDMTHTGVTVIEFPDDGEYSYPRILTYSDMSHIYREGLPAVYNKRVKI